MKTRRNKYGFTLIEMLVVVALIAILASMIIGVASHIDARAKENGIESTLVLLDGALQEYREFTDKFPEQLEQDYANAAAHSEYLYYELNSIPDSRSILEKINNFLIENNYGATGTPVGTVPEIYDPWETPLDYRYTPGENFPLIVSAGPDKKFGTADDISNK
ncbi:MAG: prepilin-type N-terminal cleavage/methylation domain-containing protein [Planctomycetota bacterium]|nr:prepilin-type N-terminal cleavage/methylation domain-containing protein [Planctomycetota bacterium]